MTSAAFISICAGVLRAIPALESIIKQAVEFNDRLRAAEALSRKQAKDNAVDAALDTTPDEKS